eukprot:TRINITY_DN18296_c0_g1_i2.p1 TRINITY_DN18296_c0_g1~~TRINITY_DN18296_c0_g1_i2.p1  ORF type:complete len:398 (-),score=99.89 TRINITY_DN18296_c0_g1_i2:320-1513(-)
MASSLASEDAPQQPDPGAESCSSSSSSGLSDEDEDQTHVMPQLIVGCVDPERGASDCRLANPASSNLGEMGAEEEAVHPYGICGAQVAIEPAEGQCNTLQEMFKKGTAIVFIETSDHKVFEVESRVAFVSPALCRGFDPTNPHTPIKLANISSHVLERILEYCRFHTATGRSAKESRAFDKRFAKVDRATMCELASAAYYMELEPLIDLTCKAIASSIDWSSPEAIRDAFGLPDDLTEEEKLEPIACDADDIRTKQYNNLLARKRKQLAESKAGNNLTSRPQEDSRSVDELLAFIGETDERTGKKKKGKRKAKKKGKAEKSGDEADLPQRRPSVELTPQPSNESLEVREDLVAKLANITVDDIENIFNEFDDDDGLDPELKAQHERELAEFSSRLGV